MSIMDPMVAGQAFDEYVATLDSQPIHEPWREGDEALPALFLSHGAPPLFDDGLWIAELARWSRSIAKPTGIVVVSAHWEQAPMTMSSTAATTPVIYDFGGFHPRYSTMTYDTPDASMLGSLVTGAVPADLAFRPSSNRGLDHGAWVPLKVMYPNGDVPVVQLSIPTHDPATLLRLGASLRPLRDRGVLVVASGFMTHGLPYLTAENFAHNTVPDWSRSFDDWVAKAIAARDLDALVGYRHAAPGLRFAHPTVEHFTPLFVSLGLGSDGGAIDTAVEGFQFGLSKRSLTIW